MPQIPIINAVKTQGTITNFALKELSSNGLDPSLDKQTILSASVAQYVMYMIKAVTAISSPIARSSFLKAVC